MGLPLRDWFRRPPLPEPEQESEGTSAGPVEANVPGVSSLVGWRGPGPYQDVLDLGPANNASLAVYSGFARRIRFLDPFPATPDARPNVFDILADVPPPAYNLVFAWNTLDRLFPEERPQLVARLVGLCAPDAHLHILVEMSETSTVDAHRFSLPRADQVAFRRSAPSPRYRPPLLPGEVERLLHPFQVLRAFTLKAGFREYVARLVA